MLSRFAVAMVTYYLAAFGWYLLPVKGNNFFLIDLSGLEEVKTVVDAKTNVTLACPGVHEQTIVSKLRWIKGNSKIVEYASETTTVWENIDRIQLVIPMFALSFQPVTAADTGKYLCLVNNWPRPIAVVQLVVNDVPGRPGVPLIGGFSSRQTNVSWVPPYTNNNNPITNYILQIKENEEDGYAKEIKTEDNRTVYTLKGLKPFSQYSVRLVAENSYGRSEPSAGSFFFLTLREAPAEPPIITAAFNGSATSIHVQWEPPRKERMNGEFSGYKLSFRPRGTEPDGPETKTFEVLDPSIRTFTIHNLRPHTQYLISIQISNPEGDGPPSTVLVMTDEGQPGQPFNLGVYNNTGDSIYLVWDRPESEGGEIKGYRIYYMHENYTDVRTSPSPEPGLMLSNLKPFTDYKIWIIAYTARFEGKSSESITHKTDVMGPNAPEITNLTCQANASVYVAWLRPTEFFFGVSGFVVQYKTAAAKKFDEETISTNGTDDPGPFEITLSNLQVDTFYEVVVLGLSDSYSYPGTTVRGTPTEPLLVYIEPDCNNLATYIFDMIFNSFTIYTGLIALIILTFFIICMACIWRKCAQTRLMMNHASRRRNGYYEGGRSTATAMRDFPQHVANMHADGDLGFSKEYEAIQMDEGAEQLTVFASQHPDNKLKNRYLNILAYDQSRVQFLPLPGEENSLTEYINANYIDGFARRAAYIGTQGPLLVTFDSFWQMIWEQNVFIIVMITNLIERGRHDKKKKSSSPGRLVYHYHYTNWPDHGTPDHALPILRFVSRSSDANPPDGGPIVVHCSAGVGRTGAYIMLDAMLKMIKYNKEVDVYSFLKHIRTQRNFLVQTEEQYIFINDALVEAIECGETYVHQAYLPKYLAALNGKPADKSLTGLSFENQYKLGTSFTPMEYHFLSARKTVNIHKNGDNPVLPMECFRVHLTPKPGIDGSDYVNASWFVGYYRLHEYIVTGVPCDKSLVQFWQLFWDHGARTAAMFVDFESEEITPFWPLEGKVLTGEAFKVSLVEEGETDGSVYRDFLFRSASEQVEWTLRIFFFPKWPYACLPFAKVYNAVHQVLEYNKQHNGPIVLIDPQGTTRAASFCVLATVLHQLQEESHADIFTYFKLYHVFRPGVWRSENDLRLLYEVVAAYAKKLPATKVPMVVPYPPGTGPTPNITVNGRPPTYTRCRRANASLDSIEDGIVTPEMESMYPAALQIPCQHEFVDEVAVNVELIVNEMPPEEEIEEEEEDGIAEHTV